jgi:hypothetical protein
MQFDLWRGHPTTCAVCQRKRTAGWRQRSTRRLLCSMCLIGAWEAASDVLPYVADYCNGQPEAEA